jgi:phosphoadenosine phosphosulfate reductase
MQDAGRVTMTSSFQAQSLPMLYLVSRICPQVPILFLDTGFHFKETLHYVDHLQRLLDLNILKVYPTITGDDAQLPWDNTDMCCYLHKVEPLQNILNNFDVWISGIRRDQTETRKHSKIIDYDAKSNVVKVCPMVNLSREIMEKINARLGLPLNPLRDQGYLSIGCQPCTEKSVGNDERSGRWGSSEKTECGLHVSEHL